MSVTIDNLVKIGVLEKEASSTQEINDLFKIVERDLNDSASSNLSYDWQFGIAYNAALKLANILVRKSGYRVKGQSHHVHTIAMITKILGDERKEDADYLDTCRRKRNLVEYDCVGGVSKEDVVELREFVIEFKKIVVDWSQNK
jgi:hypothetical protein